VIPSRRAAALAAVATCSLLAACGPSGGNGEDGKSADQIVSDAKAALKSATSFHLAGNINDGGNNIVLDMKVQDKDTTSGHMTTGGLSFDFVTAGGTFYFRGKQLWAKVNPGVADQIGDKWVSVSSSDQLASQVDQVTQLADASQLADSLGSAGGPYTKGGTSTVNGQSVVVVKSKDGSLDVALSGKPYPVHLDGGSHGKLDITEYGGSFGIKAPSGALDYSSLQGSSSSSSDSASSTSSTQAVVDAVKVRDGVLQVAEGTITESSGSVNDAWGVGQAVTSNLPASIDVSVQTGDTSSLPAATPTRIVLYAAQTSNGDVFIVVVQDTSGNCAAGELSGNPPNGNPQTKSLPAGTDCTVGNAADAFNS